MKLHISILGLAIAFVANAASTSLTPVGTVKSYKVQMPVTAAECKASYGEKGAMYGWGCRINYPDLYLTQLDRAVNCSQKVVVGSDTQVYNHECGVLSRTFKFEENKISYTVMMLVRLDTAYGSTKGRATHVDFMAYEEVWKKPIDRLDLIEKAIAQVVASPIVLYIDRVE